MHEDPTPYRAADFATRVPPNLEDVEQQEAENRAKSATYSDWVLWPVSIIFWVLCVMWLVVLPVTGLLYLLGLTRL
jgi:hypothetical protein